MKNKTNDTYNFIKPPILDNDKKVIIFAFSHFLIEDDKKRAALYRDLSNSITDKDFLRMNSTLCDLEPFRMRTEVKPQYKQTELRTVTADQKKRKKDVST